MPNVGKPSDFGIGRGAGKLGPLNLPQRRSNATPEAFGAGVKPLNWDAAAFGGQTIAPHYEPGKSGFDLLLDTVGKLADTGFDTALAVDKANTAAKIQQSTLQAATEYTQLNLAREQTIEEGTDPGKYAETALKDYDTWSATKLDGKEGHEKQALQEYLGNLKMHVMEQTTSFQAQRQRQYRDQINKNSFEAALEQADSARGVVYNDPGQFGLQQKAIFDTIDASHLPDDVKAKTKRDATGALADALWTRKVEDDPYGSRDILKTGDPALLGGLEFKELAGHLSRANQEIHRIENEAHQRQREGEADAREAKRDLEARQLYASYGTVDQAKQLGEAFLNGLPVAPEVYGKVLDDTVTGMNTASDDATRRRYFETHEALVAAYATGEYARVAQPQTLQQNMAERDRLMATNVDLSESTPEAAQLNTINNIIAKKAQAVQTGTTLEYGVESGQAKLTPLDPSNPASIAQREEDAHVNATKIGLPDDGKYQRLTKIEAAHIAQDFIETPTSDGVMAKMLGYLAPLKDDQTRRAWLTELEQQKLPPAVRFAAEAIINRKDEAGARLILGSMTTKASDLPKFGADTTKQITDAVNGAMTTPGRRANLTALRWQQTGGADPGLAARAAAERDQMTAITQSLVASGMKADAARDRAESALFGAGELAGDHDISYVVPPPAVDAETWRRTLHSARAVATPPHLGPLDPANPEDAAILRDWYGGVSYAAEQDRQRYINTIRRDGTWTDGDDGVYRLLDPTSGRTVATYTAEQIRAMATQGLPGALPKLPGSPP